MARTTTARLIATAGSTNPELDTITKKIEARIHSIKTHHAIVREKIAHQLARARLKNSKVESVSIKYGLIAILDAIYDSFADVELRDTLIKELDRLLVRLSRHHQYDGFAKSSRHAFVYYFHKLLRKQETLTSDFLPWLEAYILHWQTKDLFGAGFDLNQWKVVDMTDVLRSHRNFDMYPKKQWRSNASPFEFYQRESSTDDLAPLLDDTSESGSQFTIADVHNNPLALLYFLVEYNVLRVSKSEYEKLRDVCRKGSEQEQLDAFKDVFANFDERVVSRPLVRIMQNRDIKENQQPNPLTCLILKKLREQNVQIEMPASTQYETDNQHDYVAKHLQDPDGVRRVMVYTNVQPSDELLNHLAQQYKINDDNQSRRISLFYAVNDAQPVGAKPNIHLTNLFAPFAAGSEEGDAYVVQRIINPEQHHFELLKVASIRLLEDYLTQTHVAADRLKNALTLLDNIKQLPVTGDSFAKFQRMLNISKQMAWQSDAEEDASRFSLFRRNRFGSRYISLLDDLRERALYCLNQEQRKKIKKAEMEDYRELKAQRDARVDDDHAKRYLSQQVAQKEELIERAFKKLGG